MPKQHEITEIAEKARGELEGDAGRIVAGLWAQRPPDMSRLSQREYLAFVRLHWPEPNFRNSLLIRVGPKNFLSTYADAFGIPKDVVLDNWPIDLNGQGRAEWVVPASTAPVPQQGVV